MSINNLRDAWVPTVQQIKSTRLYQWMNKLGFHDYDSFYQKSITDIDWFWNEVIKELQITWMKPYTKTIDLSKGMAYPDWFIDGKTNVAYNAVEKWTSDKETANKTAVIWENETGARLSYSYLQLNRLVNRAAYGFERLGVTQGDVIAIYMPLIPETVIAMLAASKMGAVICPAFSGYKADALATRIIAAEAKIILTADGFFRRGKLIPMKKEADKAAAKANKLKQIVVIPYAGCSVDWEEHRDILWKDFLSKEDDYQSKPLAAQEPYMVIYTSGTTGTPKGTVHTHAGFPVKAAFDAGICMDVRREDTLFWYTDMGWMMGPFLVYGGLLNGATILLYDGTPDFPDNEQIWRIVEKHQVTHLGISPTLVRSMMKNTKQVEKLTLDSLKVIGTTGEPWNTEPWLWLFEKAGKEKIPIFNYSGGTEVSGGIFGNILIKPIRPVSFNAALPGMDARVVNQDGVQVKEKVGELVLKQPWVGMTKGFYKDNERYEKTYWNRWPNTWVHGDWVLEDREGFFTITGRSDDTLNVAGKRLGPAEIESILVEHEQVAEAGIIGVPDQLKGEKPIAFVVLAPGAAIEEGISKTLMTFVIEKMGRALAPQELYIIPELPKTRNAKVMRRAIKNAFLNLEMGDISALENPECLEAIKLQGKPGEK